MLIPLCCNFLYDCTKVPLKLKGTDLIIIEKEGIAEVLEPYADKIGVALLFTRGFATKYVRDLSELSKNAGCNVVVLSDYDDSGILLASKLKVARIGIDAKTVEYFELEREDVEEEYNPGNHLNPIWNLVSDEEYEYLSEKRIEINSVKTAVGTEKFWEWIIYGLINKERNYNRAIEVPTVVKPKDLEEIDEIIENKLKSCIESQVEIEKEGLTDIEGLIDDVPQKRVEINDRLKGILTDNPDYQDFINKQKELINSHPFFNSDGGEPS